MDRIPVGGIFTTEGTENTEKNREEGLEEIARRYYLQPVGGFPPLEILKPSLAKIAKDAK